ncbi:MAG TPA: hypothetical protein VGP73_28150 [Thermoanaerobaculia bacterium]
MKRFLPILLLLALVLTAGPARAHVGSPNVFFDGDAGPYPVRVIVRPPVVIPGLAEVTVRFRDGRKVDGVTVQPVQYKAGFKGAPPPDAATPVPGAPDTWSAQLWLMRGSSYTVRVAVRGPAGPGEALVPVTAVPMKVLKMDKGLGAVLVFLGLFLFVGAVSIVGSAVRESVLTPGEEADRQRRNRARVLSIAAAALFALALWGGRNWWNSVDGEARQGIFKPFQVRASVVPVDGRPALDLRIQDERRADWSPLMPDHGKLMHLFLIREPGLDAFAHLHPVMKDPDDFQVALPSLPAGTYRVYADVIHESGFPQTLVDTVKIPEGTGGPPQDPDDSWRASAPLGRANPDVSPLEDGGSMVWKRGPLAAGREAELRFEVRGADGRPASLEPYMGMLSHAVISKDDGQVFVHLHPMGTVSMAAQQAFAKLEKREEGKAVAVTMGQMNTDGTISFPYEFPRPGRYRLWVQVKTGGKVRTGVFDAEVGNKGAAGP